MNTKNSLDRTAIHEAGHAIMCLDVGIEIKYVTIIPDKKKDNLGCVQPKDDVPFNTNDKSEKNFISLQKRIKIGLAGDVARSKKYKEPYGEGSQNDWGELYVMAHSFFNNPHDTDEIIEFNLTKAKKLVDEYCLKDTEDIIDKKWLFIEIVAKNLLEKKVLSGTEIKNIVSQNIYSS